MPETLQSLRLASPLGLAALVAVPLVLVATRGSLARESRLRRIATWTLRSLALVLLALALGQPVIDRPNHQPWAALLVDHSASLGPEGAAHAQSFVEKACLEVAPQQLDVIPFAATPGIPATGQWANATDIDATGTDLAGALKATAASDRPFGPDRVFLLTDGNATTSGDVLAAAMALQAPVDTVPLAPRTGPDVWLEEVRTPSEVRPGTPAQIVVVVRTMQPSSASLRVTRQGELVAEKDVALAENQTNVSIQFELGPSPLDEYRMTVQADPDTQQANNEIDFTLRHGAPARALLVGRNPKHFSLLARVLQQAEAEVEIAGPEKFPPDLESLSSWDLVVLADVPAGDFNAEQLDAMEHYVRDHAGGLIVFGGENALTAGEYRDTALERIMPVTCQFDPQAKRPSLALVVAVDQSGSMEEGGAIGLARIALRKTVEMLDARDLLGVIAFQDTTRWIAPLKPCSDKEKVFREIETLQAGGGTNMLPALAKAHLALREAYADVKHLLVLTDGLSYPADFDTLAEDAAASGITISTVAVGSEAAEPLLQSIAELGGGNYHHCPTAAEIPGIFVRETAEAARMGIRDEPFLPKITPLLASIVAVPKQVPPTLLGYVQTRAKPEAKVGMTAENGDPLLAWWQVGRGRAAVFTSELQGPWTRPWKTWDGERTLWTGLVRETLRPAPSEAEQPTAPTYSAEWIPREINETLLRQVAEATGGQFNPSAGKGPGEDLPPSLETQPLGGHLIVAALILLLLELAVRRRGGILAAGRP